MTTEYRVHLEAFDGPLDLLLHLIRKAEVDVTDIPIASIADQYVDHLRHVDRIDIELAGEFLLMAATLMEIKSRMLAPAPERRGREGDEGAEETDPRADLVRQLLEYKAYRDAADRLDARREEWGAKVPAGRAGVDAEAIREAMASENDLDLGDISLLDLVQAFEAIAESVNFDRIGDHQVLDDDTPIEIHAEDILASLRERVAGGLGPAPLHALAEGRTRNELIGLFLATLELCRRRAIRVAQDGAGGPIVLALREPEPEEVPTEEPAPGPEPDA